MEKVSFSSQNTQTMKIKAVYDDYFVACYSGTEFRDDSSTSSSGSGSGDSGGGSFTPSISGSCGCSTIIDPFYIGKFKDENNNYVSPSAVARNVAENLYQSCYTITGVKSGGYYNNFPPEINTIPSYKMQLDPNVQTTFINGLTGFGCKAVVNVSFDFYTNPSDFTLSNFVLEKKGLYCCAQGATLLNSSYLTDHFIFHNLSGEFIGSGYRSTQIVFLGTTGNIGGQYSSGYSSTGSGNIKNEIGGVFINEGSGKVYCVEVLKPFSLRKTPFAGKTIGGITYTYASGSDQERIARYVTGGSKCFSGENSIEKIIPPYKTGDIIYGTRSIPGGPDNGGIASGDSGRFFFIDENRDARKWIDDNCGGGGGGGAAVWL